MVYRLVLADEYFRWDLLKKIVVELNLVRANSSIIEYTNAVEATN